MLFQQELIQNAEDAGATTVKFVYDENTFPSDKLHHDGMKKFQVTRSIFNRLTVYVL